CCAARLAARIARAVRGPPSAGFARGLGGACGVRSQESGVRSQEIGVRSLSKKEIITHLFQGALCNVQKARLVGLASAAKAFDDIGRNGNRRPSQLGY